MKVKLICVQTLFSHWSQYSGYHQYLKYLANDFDIEHIRVEPTNYYISQSIMRLFCNFLYKRRISKAATINDIFNEISLIKKIKHALKYHQQVIVHFMDGEYGYNWLNSFMKLNLFSRKRIKITATYHQPPSILNDLISTTECISALDLIFTVGSNQLSYFETIKMGSVKFIHHGIDTNYFKPGGQRPADESIICITVGHWLRDFKTLSKIIERSPMNIRFRIVANPDNLRSVKKDHRVEILSGISDTELLGVYQSSDIGLMPLIDTTANNGILEMMACGLPIITTNVGAIRDYVDDQMSIIVPNNSAESMVRFIIELGKDKDRREKLSLKSRERALELDWTKIALRMKEAYNHLIA